MPKDEKKHLVDIITHCCLNIPKSKRFSNLSEKGDLTHELTLCDVNCGYCSFSCCPCSIARLMEGVCTGGFPELEAEKGIKSSSIYKELPLMHYKSVNFPTLGVFIVKVMKTGSAIGKETDICLPFFTVSAIIERISGFEHNRNNKIYSGKDIDCCRVECILNTVSLRKHSRRTSEPFSDRHSSWLNKR
jgi:hypothetical protein